MAERFSDTATRVRRSKRVVRGTPAPPAPTGNLWMSVTYDNLAESVRAEWDRAAAPLGGLAGTVGGSPGVTRVTDVVHRGAASCRLDLPVNTGGSHRAEWGPLGPFKKYVEQYYGVAIYLPSSWNWSACGPWGIVCTQYGLNDLWAGFASLNLGGPIDSIAASGIQQRMAVTVQTGLSSTSNSQYSLYASVMPAPMQLATWYEIIVGVYLTDFDNGTGWTRSWWRTKGQTSWTTGGSVEGKPTMQWTSAEGQGGATGRRDGAATTPPNLAYKWGMYRGGPAPAAFMYQDSHCRGDTFAVVESVLTTGAPSYQAAIGQFPAG